MSDWKERFVQSLTYDANKYEQGEAFKWKLEKHGFAASEVMKFIAHERRRAVEEALEMASFKVSCAGCYVHEIEGLTSEQKAEILKHFE